MAEEVKGFANLMRYCNTLEDYNQKKADGKVTDDVLVIVLEDKLIKFKGQTFNLSGEGSGEGSLKYAEERTAYITSIDLMIGEDPVVEELEISQDERNYNLETYEKFFSTDTPSILLVLSGNIYTIWEVSSQGVTFGNLTDISKNTITIDSIGNAIMVSRPNQGGGNIDPELFEGFIPLSRDFSDDFNNDFAR